MPPEPAGSPQAVVPSLVIPREALAGEIELAIAYTAACNQNLSAYLLTTRRAEFARAIADMLAERASNGLSGMVLLGEP